MSGKTRTGTFEWADWTLNVQRGCSYGCLYCYGRAAALRRKRIPDGEAWRRPVVNAKALQTRYRRRTGPGMFPSTHDITRANVHDCLKVLVRLLEVGNRLVIVSKPDLAVWRTVLEALAPYKSQVVLRFTIGALDSDLVRAWEPEAPPVPERLETLGDAWRAGFATSVSAEPLLDPPRAADLVREVAPLVAETIWIGSCRQLRKRVAWCIRRPGVLERVRQLEAGQTPGGVRAVDAALAALPAGVREKVRYKDSYKNALRREGPKKG